MTWVRSESVPAVVREGRYSAPPERKVIVQVCASRRVTTIDNGPLPATTVLRSVRANMPCSRSISWL